MDFSTTDQILIQTNSNELGKFCVHVVLKVTRPQVPYVTQNGFKELDLQKWLETWCRSQLPALKGVEGLGWKLRDLTRKRSSYLVTNLHPKSTQVG
jgi:hypothetical protein